MALNILFNSKALAVGRVVPFKAVGGTGPYTYSVLAGGAGGAIVSGTGIYTAPNSLNEDPTKNFDTIRVVDSLAAQFDLQISIKHPLQLVCDIIESELGLPPGRVYLWDQKIMEPTDKDLYVVVQEVDSKIFGNVIKPDENGNMLQGVNVNSLVQIDIKSRGNSALLRKNEVPMSLNSAYSRNQQKLNSFNIGKNPSRMVNLSETDGPARPYRFTFSVYVQYFEVKSKAVPYYDNFSGQSFLIDP